MMNMLKKVLKFIGLDKSVNCLFNSFIIGKTCYLVLEFDNNCEIIYNRIISEIIRNRLEFYWFRSYNEFENNMDDVVTINDDYLIILIG